MACFALPPSGNSVPASFLMEAGGEDFPDAFAAHSGFPADRTLFAASGAAALYVALRGASALRPDRTAVAVPAWCCPSVPQAVMQAGLRPVLVDLDPSTLAYDEASLHDARDEGLLAVVLVHFFGLPQTRPAGDWSGTVFLRDCAQDFDHRHDPEDDAPCFYSFGRGKALNSGHGGALCLAEPGPLPDACREVLGSLPISRAHPFPKALAINLLSQPRLFWALTRLPFLGIGATVWNAPLGFERLSPGFGPLGSACLEAYLQRRDFYRGLIARYRNLMADCDGDWAYSPSAPRAALPTRFPVLARDQALRDDLLRIANARFGGVTRMYPAILPELPGAPKGIGGGAFPGARRIADEILTLPVTAELMGMEERFTGCLEEVLSGHGALRKRAAPAAGPDWTPVPLVREQAASPPARNPDQTSTR